MVMLESGNSARMRRKLRRSAQDTKATHDFMDAYVCWTVDRSDGWADGDSVEALAIVGEGTGKLHENGKGGPQSGDLVIHLESPYRFQTHISAGIESGNMLVLNEQRLFRVDIVKPEDTDDLLMDVYLTELFNTPIPEVPSAPIPEVP